MMPIRSRIKSVLAFLILLLYLANYHICNFFFGDDLINWWRLKLIIYTAIIGLAFALARIGTIKLTRFILSLGLGFCIAGVVDRIIYPSQSYRWVDIAMVVLTIGTSYFDVYVNRRRKL